MDPTNPGSSTGQSWIQTSSLLLQRLDSPKFAAETLQAAVEDLEKHAPTGAIAPGANEERLKLMRRGVEDLQEMSQVPTTNSSRAVRKITSFISQNPGKAGEEGTEQSEYRVSELNAFLIAETAAREAENPNYLIITVWVDSVNDILRDVNDMMDEYRSEIASASVAEE